MMACQLFVGECAQIAARYEVWNCIVLVQRWWCMAKGRNATIRLETVKNYHLKLMTTDSVKDAGRSGRLFTSWFEKNVATAWEVLTCSPGKSTHQAARESGQ
jgi:hypothetical protein